MKTVALRQALDAGGYDAAFGGARRDEEVRAKERVFCFRDKSGWDPETSVQALEYLQRHHRPGESIRVFPLSNWTELDIWQYIHLEEIYIVPLYYSAKRPVVGGGNLIMVDDERLPRGGRSPSCSVRFGPWAATSPAEIRRPRSRRSSRRCS